MPDAPLRPLAPPAPDVPPLPPAPAVPDVPPRPLTPPEAVVPPVAASPARPPLPTEPPEPMAPPEVPPEAMEGCPAVPPAPVTSPADDEPPEDSRPRAPRFPRHLRTQIRLGHSSCRQLPEVGSLIPEFAHPIVSAARIAGDYRPETALPSSIVAPEPRTGATCPACAQWLSRDLVDPRPGAPSWEDEAGRRPRRGVDQNRDQGLRFPRVGEDRWSGGPQKIDQRGLFGFPNLVRCWSAVSNVSFLDSP